ncbi:conserved hypothetical protein [Ixodes scapularis]|uniref:F-box domain-containing protein n=1 Tax=Ixodes scapularis TaxID=6945 RepID=B7P8X4_IXOSC|nr:conserved hypothetical protein [Ixodes scapularis]|eukprot:XP_002403296.1 conserved hypothetical protein [Ixodes scapularis]
MGNAMAMRLMENDDEDLANFAASSLPLLELPERLIERVLSFVPAGDLLKACRFVCGSFGRIVEGNGLWELKCEREGKYIPNLEWHPLPPNYYRGLYAGIPYFQNLLHLASRGSREESRRCLCKHPCGVCTKQQVVDLVEMGVDLELLDSFKPPIEVSEWYAAQVGFGSGIYRMMVELRNAEQERLARYDTGEVTVNNLTRFRWKEVNHTFSNYPSGIRYIYFAHEGRGLQFWGAPDIAGGTVRFVPEQTSRCAVDTQEVLELVKNCSLCSGNDST